MLHLSLNGLKVTSEIIGIEGYIASESKGGEYHDVDPANINKTIREIRKENRDEEKILRDLDFTFDPEKVHYEPKKSATVFNNNYIPRESIRDIDKASLPKDYLDVIRPDLSNIIKDYKTQGGWKIYLTIGIKFVSSQDSDESRKKKKKSDNIGIMMVSETYEIIEELFESHLKGYQEALEESMKGSEFTFDSVDVLYYNLNKISFNCG